MHATISVGCDQIEQGLSQVERATGACWACVVAGALVYIAVIIDVDLLAAQRVVVRVCAVLHIVCRHGDEIVAV